LSVLGTADRNPREPRKIYVRSRRARRRLPAIAWVAAGLVAFPELAHAGEAGRVQVVRREEPIHLHPDTSAPRRGAAILGATLPAFGTRVGPGCASPWVSVGPLAWICGDGVAAGRFEFPPEQRVSAGGLPYTYYFVSRDGSFGYRDLATAEEGVPDAQLLPGFGVAIARVGAKPGADPFGLTTHGLWVPLRDLNGPVTPLPSLAVELEHGEAAWVTTERAAIYAAPGKRLVGATALERLARVSVLERVELRREAWLRISANEWLRAADTVSPRPAPLPDGLRPGERWLDVDLERQVVTAYRGDRPQFAMLASTGRGAPGSELATPVGMHRLWIKLLASDMDNLENLEARENYAIQAVPWVMYFQRGYGLHGTFWHRAFGRVQSHGCVNLTPADAERLFAWTSPHLPAGWSAVFPTDYELGTLVRVR
jgi:hypothetical protein